MHALRAVLASLLVAGASPAPCDRGRKNALLGTTVLQGDGDFRAPIGDRAYSAGPRDPLPGEGDPEEGMSELPTHNATLETLGRVIYSLEPGARYKVRLFFTASESVGFFLWLPVGFGRNPAPNSTNSSEPWPTVFFLHGRGEAVPVGDSPHAPCCLPRDLRSWMALRPRVSRQPTWRGSATLSTMAFRTASPSESTLRRISCSWRRSSRRTSTDSRGTSTSR